MCTQSLTPTPCLAPFTPHPLHATRPRSVAEHSCRRGWIGLITCAATCSMLGRRQSADCATETRDPVRCRKAPPVRGGQAHSSRPVLDSRRLAHFPPVQPTRSSSGLVEPPVHAKEAETAPWEPPLHRSPVTAHCHLAGPTPCATLQVAGGAWQTKTAPCFCCQNVGILNGTTTQQAVWGTCRLVLVPSTKPRWSIERSHEELSPLPKRSRVSHWLCCEQSGHDLC